VYPLSLTSVRRPFLLLNVACAFVSSGHSLGSGSLSCTLSLSHLNCAHLHPLTLRPPSLVHRSHLLVSVRTLSTVRLQSAYKVSERYKSERSRRLVASLYLVSLLGRAVCSSHITTTYTPFSRASRTSFLFLHCRSRLSLHRLLTTLLRYPHPPPSLSLSRVYGPHS